jgi:hypothetical protein
MPRVGEYGLDENVTGQDRVFGIDSVTGTSKNFLLQHIFDAVTTSSSNIFKTRIIQVTEENGGVDFIQVINEDISGFTIQTGEVAFVEVTASPDTGGLYKETHVMIRPSVTTAIIYGFGNTQVATETFLLLRSVADGASGEDNTNSTVGGSYSIVVAKNGVDLPLKGFNSGSGITITDDGTKLTITCDITQAEINTLDSLGTGTHLIGGKVASSLRLKSITAKGINVTSDNNEVDLHVWDRKTITTDYTIASADDKKTIFVNSGVNDVDITVPSGLPSDFSQAYVHLGTGNIIFLGSGTTLLGTKLKIKSQYNQAWIEKSPVGTETFVLLGNVEV